MTPPIPEQIAQMEKAKAAIYAAFPKSKKNLPKTV
jgi:hypothetical protein